MTSKPKSKRCLNKASVGELAGRQFANTARRPKLHVVACSCAWACVRACVTRFSRRVGIAKFSRMCPSVPSWVCVRHTRGRLDGCGVQGLLGLLVLFSSWAAECSVQTRKNENAISECLPLLANNRCPNNGDQDDAYQGNGDRGNRWHHDVYGTNAGGCAWE